MITTLSPLRNRLSATIGAVTPPLMFQAARETEPPNRPWPWITLAAEAAALPTTRPGWLRRLKSVVWNIGGRRATLARQLHFKPMIERGLALAMSRPMQPIAFKAVDGVKLQGYWLPATDELGEPVASRKKTVVMGHGYNCDYRGLLELAGRLRRAGYHLFLFDFRGHGKSEGTSTLGFKEGRDVAAAVRTVMEDPALKPLVEPEGVYYFGHSMGASAFMQTPRSLSDTPNALEPLHRLRGVILDSPYAYLPPTQSREMMDQLAAGQVIPAGGLSTDVLITLDRMAEKDFGTRLSRMRPGEALLEDETLSRLPMLHIHGSHDETTPVQHARLLYEQLSARNPNLHPLPLPETDHRVVNWGWGEDKRNRYYTVMRGGDAYLEGILSFLENPAQYDSSRERGLTPDGNPF